MRRTSKIGDALDVFARKETRFRTGVQSRQETGRLPFSSSSHHIPGAVLRTPYFVQNVLKVLLHHERDCPLWTLLVSYYAPSPMLMQQLAVISPCHVVTRAMRALYIVHWRIIQQIYHISAIAGC